MTVKQLKQKLVEAGIGEKYYGRTLSELMPNAVSLVVDPVNKAAIPEWLKNDQHVITIADSPVPMLVFCGALLLDKNVSVYVIDVALLIHALETDDETTLARAKSGSVLGLLGFFDVSHSACPFTRGQVRLLEGFLSYVSRELSISLVMDSNADSDKINWYSAHFKQLIFTESLLAQ